MRALLGFVWGLFAHHIGTKTLSLLLAILLFFFVQQSGTGSQDIAEINLRFTLAEDLRDDYVLLTNSVHLTEVKIQGKRSVVEEVAREYALNSTREVTITRAFLGAHQSGSRIPITSRLIRDIESRQIDVVAGLDGQAIRYDNSIRRSFDVILAPGQEDKRRLVKDGPYLPVQGDSVDVRFSIERVTITGPRRAFDLNAEAQKEGTLLVVIPDLNRALRGYQTEEDEPEVVLPIVSGTPPEGGVDWKKSGIDPGLLDFVEIVEPRWMTSKVFDQTLQMTFKVRAQVESVTLDVGIVLRRPLTGGKDLSEWRILGGPLIDDTNLQKGTATLQLRMPVTLKARAQELGRNLVLVLDLTRAKEGDTDMTVPTYLDFKDRAEGRLEDLRRISIDAPDTEVTFEKKD